MPTRNQSRNESPLDDIESLYNNFNIKSINWNYKAIAAPLPLCTAPYTYCNDEARKQTLKLFAIGEGLFGGREEEVKGLVVKLVLIGVWQRRGWWWWVRSGEIIWWMIMWSARNSTLQNEEEKEKEAIKSNDNKGLNHWRWRSKCKRLRRLK